MSNVLHILVEQAQEKADECARSLAKSRQQLAQAEDKLSMLESYKQECQQGVYSRSMNGITGNQLQSQMAYVNKVDEALTQQQEQVKFLTLTVEKMLTQWQGALAEQKKFETLITREKQRQAALEAKRDQKMNDEYAARIYRSHATGESR